MRINRTFTVGAGPFNVASGLTTAAAETNRTIATRVFIQMLTAGTGLGYVMDGIRPGRVPSILTAADVTAELAPATATAPGGTYEDADPAGIDLSRLWIHGAHAGDTIKVSYVPKV